MTELPTVYLLWDIDGTLTTTARDSSAIFRRALANVLGVRNPELEVWAHGKTDWQIVDEFLQLLPTSDGPGSLLHEAILTEAERLTVQDLASGSSSQHLLPGVRDFLTSSLTHGVVHGVVTGNTRTRARAKLAAFDLDEFIRWDLSAFGDSAPNRKALLVALQERLASTGVTGLCGVTPWVIGDTPADVDAARSVGWHAVAVATGQYSVDDLRAAGADFVLGSLTSDAAKFAELLGLSSLKV